MKKKLKSFTFWFMILGLIFIVANLIGEDDNLILLIGLNPLSNYLPMNIMGSGFTVQINPTFGPVSIYWYIFCFASYTFYGFVIDTVIIFYKTKIRKTVV